jgi:phosphoserine phosphatase
MLAEISLGALKMRGRVVDELVVYGAPVPAQVVLGQAVSPQTRYVVFDLDRTIHRGRNLGELLGWELCAEVAYGADGVEALEARRGPGRFALDWRRPWALGRYLGIGAARWGRPGLAYWAGVKLGFGHRWAQPLLRGLGPDPVGALQGLTRETLLHQLAGVPEDTLRAHARRIWQRHAADQVFTAADIEAVRALAPGVCVVVSSASPQAVVDVAVAALGADVGLGTTIESVEARASAPHRVDRRYGLPALPGRIAPPSSLRHNAGLAKVQALRARFTDFDQVEVVGITDTDHGEDHAWTEHFTCVADVNSHAPFSPVVRQASPLRRVVSAQVQTRAEAGGPVAEPVRLTAADLERRLAPWLIRAGGLFADLDAEASGPTLVAHAAVAAVLRDTERAVQAYNAAEPEARGVLYQRVHAQAVAERAARRRLARVQRPLTRLTVALQETLAEARVAAVA